MKGLYCFQQLLRPAYWLLIGLVLCSILVDSLFAQSDLSKNPTGGFRWLGVEPGYSIGRYPLGDQLLSAEVFLVKFNPAFYTFTVVNADGTGKLQSDVRTLTKSANGIAGINANFFDGRGLPLGLLVADGVEKNRMHWGGKLLTGVFLIENNLPTIIRRDDFKSHAAMIAVQAGPRLIEKGKTLRVSSVEGTSRRSGIAITNTNEVIMFATFLRFPGATLERIQEMLVDPQLDVAYALNLDGGGSSQLFVEKNQLLADETFISGGDKVPVALVVKKKN